MFDKKLFDKICNITCTFGELKEFCNDIDKKEFDLENPFDKYFRVDRIISVIEKYQSKEINARFLSYWMNAYDWIIMGGFKIEEDDKSISLKEFLVWVLTDWLDSLSFFDSEADCYNLEEYKRTFQVLSMLLTDVNQCEAVFAEYGDNEDEVVVLITNIESGYFIKVYGEQDYSNYVIDFTKVNYDELINRTNRLLDLGYQEIKYCD